MILGLDRLLSSRDLLKQLEGKRVSVLAHPASMTADFRHSLDALIAAKVNVTSAFGPQHGMRGEKQDNMMETEDFIDPVHKIPVFSLYGEVRRPNARMMDTFDVLLVDIQDVGTRIYTFLTTLLYVMEEAAKAGKAVWVLDRPNPAGRPVEGSLLRPGWVSFVGATEGLPMRHGLTLGEAGLWFKKVLKIDVDYRVIEMQGYDMNEAPGYGWPLNELSWVNPSPNAANVSMARAFPGTVLIEGTTLSEGRGTTRPLETMGAPDIDMPAILKVMEKIAPQWLKGCFLRPTYFLPTFQKHAGKICSGLQIHVDQKQYDHEAFRPYRLVGLWLRAIREVHPDYQIWRDFHYEYEKTRLAFDLINGGPQLREWVDARGSTAADLDAICVPDERAWTESRKEFLLY
ncbi:MAG: DUF1343 domain-containing protein [Proteobacteria bacterium]|nr:MAG: DUF1343 domain-containing protein [Pseudomonadota bacterium]